MSLKIFEIYVNLFYEINVYNNREGKILIKYYFENKESGKTYEVDYIEIKKEKNEVTNTQTIIVTPKKREAPLLNLYSMTLKDLDITDKGYLLDYIIGDLLIIDHKEIDFTPNSNFIELYETMVNEDRNNYGLEMLEDRIMKRMVSLLRLSYIFGDDVQKEKVYKVENSNDIMRFKGIFVDALEIIYRTII